MPMRYMLDKGHRLMLVTGSGRLTAADVKAVLDQARRDPDFNADFDEFVDLRAVTEIDIAADEIRTLTRRKLWSPKSRRAFLAPNPVAFGMSRMWQAYIEFFEDMERIAVFYDLSKALKWLGLKSLPSGTAVQ